MRLPILFAVTTLMAASAAAADVPGQHSVTIRNDTSLRVECGVHADGTSVEDLFVLKPGASRTERYAGDKRRWLRCQGAYSEWQRLALDGDYALVGSSQRILATRATH